VKGWFLSYREG